MFLRLLLLIGPFKKKKKGENAPGFDMPRLQQQPSLHSENPNQNVIFGDLIKHPVEEEESQQNRHRKINTQINKIHIIYSWNFRNCASTN